MMGKTCQNKLTKIFYHTGIHMAIPLWYAYFWPAGLATLPVSPSCPQWVACG